MQRARQASFRHEGHRLAYTEHGAGPRVVVLLHGLLFSQRMHEPLARALAERGNRAITLDLLGHGKSDRPHDMWKYSITLYAEEVVGLLDHLEVEEAVVFGSSLGANATLELALAAPDRLRGMVLEMPVLDNALLAAALTFTPLLVALTFGRRVMKAAQAGARLVPARLTPWTADLLLDVLRQDPAPSAALIQGLFFGRTAPHRRDRRTLTTPALVIGHRRDPLHPFSDAGMLAEELPNGRLLEAESIVELLVAPRRLTEEIAGFVDDCWKPRAAERRRLEAS